MRNGTIIHPFLLAVFPTLALLVNNLDQVRPLVAYRTLMVSLAAAAGLVLVFRFLLRDWGKATLASTVILVFFFSYGHIYNAVREVSVLGRHRSLVPIYIAVLLLGLWWVAKIKDPSSVNRLLNVMAAVTLVFPLFQLFAFEIESARIQARLESERQTQRLQLQKTDDFPDIYYIILDGYTRDDLLAEVYSYDNHLFLEELERLGFYIARCGQSNYSQTALSLASSMNMNYIEEIYEKTDPERTEAPGLGKLIRFGKVRSLLEDLGYRTVAFETGFYWTQMDDADAYFRPTPSNRLGIFDNLNGFETMLFRSSAGLIFADLLLKTQVPDVDLPDTVAHRERVNFALDKLQAIPTIQSPKFVFAHIVSPHGPFIFGPNGEFTEGNVKKQIGYPNQVTYINKRILPAIEAILTESHRPPVIVIQGDHGSDMDDVNGRMAILNAYYLPDGGDQLLYETITPVNSFRLIFNHYFGSDFDLLEDTSYYSAYDYLFQFTVVPPARPGCEN